MKPKAYNWRLVGGIGAIVLLVLVYFVGRFQGGTALATSRQRVDSTEATAQLLGAHGWLFRAAIDLAASNFGTAQTDISKADLALGSVDPRRGGVDASGLKAIHQEVGQIHVQVTGDVGEQRARILDSANRVDALLPSQVGGVQLK